MTYYGASELAAAFRTVRKNTIKVAEDIPEEQYEFVPAPDTRSVGRHIVHIAMAPHIWMQIHEVEKRTTMVGFDFGAVAARVLAEEATPRTKAQVLELLRTEGEVVADWLEGLSEDFLAERVIAADGQPPGRTRFENLLGMKEHEMHHRAQLMLIERQLGIVPHLTRQMQERLAQSRERAASATATAGGTS